MVITDDFGHSHLYVANKICGIGTEDKPNQDISKNVYAMWTNLQGTLHPLFFKTRDKRDKEFKQLIKAVK